MSKRRAFRVVTAVVIAVAIAACGRNDPAKFIASAETYLAKSNYPAAIIELKNALSQAPPTTRRRVSCWARRRSRRRSGIGRDRVPQGARAQVPGRRGLSVACAGAGAAGRSEGRACGVRECAGAGALDAKAEIANVLAIAYLSYGQPKDARVQVDAALALEPSNVSARVTQARLVAAEGNPPVRWRASTRCSPPLPTISAH